MTVVPRDKVLEEELVIGCGCKVKDVKGTHMGKLAALGKHCLN